MSRRAGRNRCTARRQERSLTRRNSGFRHPVPGCAAPVRACAPGRGLTAPPRPALPAWRWRAEDGFLVSLPPRRYVIYLGFLAILAAFSIVLRNDGFASPANLIAIIEQTTP